MSFILTRPAAEVVLIGRVGRVYTIAGLDGTTVTGANADLTGPFLYSLGLLGIVPVAYPAVSDVDLVTIVPDMPDAPGSLAQFLDVAELQARGNALDAFQDVDQQVDRDNQKWDQLAERWAARIDKLAAYCKTTYGVGADTLGIGILNLGFQQERCFPVDPGGDLQGGWF
jgi:hypothetical protein